MSAARQLSLDALFELRRTEMAFAEDPVQLNVAFGRSEGYFVGQCRSFELYVIDRRRTRGVRSICSLYADRFGGEFGFFETHWHTWDARGIGGENDTEKDLVRAAEIGLSRCLRQGFIKRVTAADVDVVINRAHQAQLWLREEADVRWPTRHDKARAEAEWWERYMANYRRRGALERAAKAAQT